MDELASTSDVIIVTLSLNDETSQFVNSRFLSGVKRSAVLVNTSRGAVVDQPALVQALRSGRLAGAGLDVMTPEPLGPDHELAGMENVVLTPHMGSATTAAREAMAGLTVDNILAGLRGDRLPAEIPGGGGK